mmetsp:Transcript_14769/g.30793  ORF Transcript_14769/g.30793 Transcript_14769/m.30793 type:complete len:117 (-) Transcript_14769:298-648(-)
MILYRDSASSRKLCSMPKWALTLAHWTAPVKDTAPGRKSSILEEEILRLDSAVNDTQAPLGSQIFLLCQCSHKIQAKEGHQHEHAESSTCQKKVLGEKTCNNRGKKKLTKILRRRP